jgi:hypothetical protein
MQVDKVIDDKFPYFSFDAKVASLQFVF